MHGRSFHGFSGVGAGTHYPDPFLDVASLHQPNQWKSLLYWCEHVYSVFGTYSSAMERVISYFLTDFSFDKTSTDEQEKWGDFYRNTLKLICVLKDAMRDNAAYGNAFLSMNVPFKRFLSCPRCGYRAPLKEIYENPAFGFKWQIPEFHANCAACRNYRGKWIVRDEEDDLEKKLKIKTWSPHQIEILHHTYSGDNSYLWRIPEEEKNQVRRGYLYYLERTPIKVIEAIHRNQMYRFNDGAIFHMKEPCLSGIANRGWGIPRLLRNFRQIWYVQVLRRFNEAIALDYVVPYRVITPMPASAGTAGGMGMDPLQMYNGGDFRQQINAMHRRRARDPGGLHTLPFPVNFQMFGADANKLAPRELHDQGMQTLLNDAGVPQELFNGSLQLQAAPVALRLFESTWYHLVHDANQLLRWVNEQASQILSWEKVESSLKRVTIADNLEKQMMAAQLMMSQQLSRTTVLRDLGYDQKQERNLIAEELKGDQEIQARIEEESQTAGLGAQIAKGMVPGAPAPGGAPAPQQGAAPAPAQGAAPAGPGAGGGPVDQFLASMSPSTPLTPEDMLNTASSLADQLLGLPEGVKDSQLRKLKQSPMGPALHPMVKSLMEEKRKAAQQQAQGGGGM